MIYRSQEPLRILGDLSDDVTIKVARLSEESSAELKNTFNEFPRLEKPLKAFDMCYLYANSQFYVIVCDER